MLYAIPALLMKMKTIACLMKMPVNVNLLIGLGSVFIVDPNVVPKIISDKSEISRSVWMSNNSAPIVLHLAEASFQLQYLFSQVT